MSFGQIIYFVSLLLLFFGTIAGAYSAGIADWARFAGCCLVVFVSAVIQIIGAIQSLGYSVSYEEIDGDDLE